jgi:predicted transcriptional regulator
MGRRFAAAFDRAAAGEDFEERHITFMSLEEMLSALTPKRLEMLRRLRREGGAESIRALGRALGRDYKRVHEDVTALEAAGLVVRDGVRLRTPWDVLSAELAI